MAFAVLNTIATLAGLAGVAYAGYGAMSFQPVPRFGERLSMCEPDPAQWARLAAFGQENEGDIVIVNATVDFDAGNCTTADSSRRYERASVDLVVYSFSSRFGQRSPDQTLFPDNGLSVIFKQPHVMPNTLTRMQFDIEGLEDRISGPMQAAVAGDDASYILTFSPPNLNDTQARRVACTQKDWSQVRMALMCPLSNP